MSALSNGSSGGGATPSRAAAKAIDILRRRRLEICDVPEPALEVRGDQRAEHARDVGDVNAVEHLAWLDDAPRPPFLQLDERIAAGAVDAGEPQHVDRDLSLAPQREPPRFGRQSRQGARRFGDCRRSLVDPVAVRPAIDADRREIEDAAKPWRGADIGLEGVQRRLGGFCRRDRDEQDIALRERLPQVGVLRAELERLDASAAPRGARLGRAHRARRLQAAVLVHETRSAVTEAEYEKSHSVFPARQRAPVEQQGGALPCLPGDRQRKFRK